MRGWHRAVCEDGLGGYLGSGFDKQVADIYCGGGSCLVLHRRSRVGVESESEREGRGGSHGKEKYGRGIRGMDYTLQRTRGNIVYVCTLNMQHVHVHLPSSNHSLLRNTSVVDQL